MSIDRIMAELQSNVWAMDAGKLSAIAGVLSRKDAGLPVAVPAESPEMRLAREQAEVAAVASSYQASGGAGTVTRTDYGMRAGAVAVINVGGVIAPRASMVNGSSLPRGTSLEALRGARMQAERDPEVSSVLYRVNSPGGYAEGLAEFADELTALGGDPASGMPGKGKPAWSYVEGMGCSAAYWIPSQTSRVESAKDAMVGSIGTYMVVYDQSKAAEKDGIEVNLIRSPESERSVKGVGVPGTEVTEAARANWQRGTDSFQKFFSASVGRGRRMSAERVAELATGETWMGEEAKAKGLVDAVRPIGETLAEMNRRFPAKGDGSLGAAAMVAASGLSAAEFVTGVVRGIAERLGIPAEMATQKEHGLEARATSEAAVASALDGVTAQPEEAGGKVDMRLHGAASVLLAASAAAAGQEAGGNGGGAPTGGGAEPKSDALKFDREATLAEGRRAEAARRSALAAIAKPFMAVEGVADALAKAQEDHTVTEDTFRRKVMDVVAEAQKPAGLTQAAGLKISVGTTGVQRWTGAVAVGLFARANPGMDAKLSAGGPEADRIARAMGYASAAEYTKTRADADSGGMRQRRLSSLAEDYLRMTGVDPSAMGPEGVFSATFGQGSGDFANLMLSTASKSLQASYAEQPTTWRKWCAIGSNPDFKASTRVGLSDAPNLKQVLEAGALEGAKMSDRKFTASVDTYGRSFGISRVAFINDDLGAFTRLPALFGAAAARLPEDLAVAKLVANPTLPDTYALFHANHNNLPTGAALAMSSLNTAIIAMRNQKGFGESTPYLDVQPRYLLTGTTLAGTAKELYESKNNPTTGEANPNRINIVAGAAEPISTPRITSAVAWYLFADPNLYPVIEVTFLQGRQVPLIVPKPQTSIADGPQWEMLFDCAANAVGFEGAQYNAGP